MNHQAQLQVLKDYFGYDTFRALQQEIIEDVLNGLDTLVIMPTGGGKSVCFQVPALLLPGLTLVISPLIALMKDQVDGLKTNGIPAAYYNSSQSFEEQQNITERIFSKEIKLLYAAPESLSHLDNILRTVELSMIAIDEAHCISAWGHDFRPAYTQLGFLKKQFPNVPIIALTATADSATRDDICKQLNITNAKRHLASFDRKNLSLEVRPGTKRIQQIVSFVERNDKESGIIYCLSRKTTEQIASKLAAAGFEAAAYHAGMSFEERSSTQEQFINDTTKIVCATVAFGMGIDKSNVRWVIHYNLPKNIEGYYQEIGRAGRDGLPSSTILFHSYADVMQLQKFADEAKNAEVQLAKLERMKQYADALSCRRRVLLSYFGETIERDCGNCDICKAPPTIFDGTLLAQKVLSAITRLREQESLTVLVDVLRGSQNAAIYDKGYQHIKTYGAARDVPWNDLQQYIIQLINQGYIEIAFHQKNRLKLTSLSQKVLFEGQKVQLANLEAASKTKEKKQQTALAIPDANSLFEVLRKLRLQLAQEAGVPAYQIFNDASLRAMEEVKPLDKNAMLAISGVGKVKLERFGQQFIDAIAKYASERYQKRTTIKGATYKLTSELYEKGLKPEAIAEKRGLSVATIFSHLIKLREQGSKIDLLPYINKKDLEALKKAKKVVATDNPTAMKPFFRTF